MRARLSVWGALFVAVAASTPDVRFADATKAVGIAFAHKNSATSNKYLIETMGGGVALLDYDNDGRLDIFLTNGAQARRPDARRQAAGQVRRGILESPVSSDSGRHVRRRHGEGRAHRHAAEPYGMGVAVGDYDNDGFEDLYVTNYGGNTLYHNNGNGTFTDVTSRAGVAAGGWSASAGFFDYDNDGKLDLFVTRYVDWSFQNNRYCGEKKPGYRVVLPPRQLRRRDEHPVSQQRRRHVHRRLREGRHRRSRTARGSVSRSPTTTAMASSTSMWRTIRCSRSCSTTTATARSRRSACWPASASTRTARRSPEWASTSPTTTTTAVPTSSSPIFRTSATCCSGRTRDGSFRDVTNTTGRRRRHAAVFRLEHALLRLRQRWLEGSLRRAGARHGHDREDRAQPEVPAAAVAVAERVGAIRRESLPEKCSNRNGPAAAPRSAIWTTTATSTSC